MSQSREQLAALLAPLIADRGVAIVARGCGVTAQSVRDWAAGMKIPRRKHWYPLLQTLDVRGDARLAANELYFTVRP